jgi:hypothetical protein
MPLVVPANPHSVRLAEVPGNQRDSDAKTLRNCALILSKDAYLDATKIQVRWSSLLFGIMMFLIVAVLEFPPAWIPGRLLIGYLTGAILLVAGVGILLAKKTRMAATYLGTWIVLLVVFIYGPILIAALADPSTAVKIEGINYFADTLLFGGAILALASATPRTD